MESETNLYKTIAAKTGITVDQAKQAAYGVAYAMEPETLRRTLDISTDRANEIYTIVAKEINSFNTRKYSLKNPVTHNKDYRPDFIDRIESAAKALEAITIIALVFLVSVGVPICALFLIIKRAVKSAINN